MQVRPQSPASRVSETEQQSGDGNGPVEAVPGFASGRRR